MFSPKDRGPSRYCRNGHRPAPRSTRLAVERLETRNAPGAIFGSDTMELSIAGPDAGDAITLPADANAPLVLNESPGVEASGTPTGQPISPTDGNTGSMTGGLLVEDDHIELANNRREAGPISIFGDEAQTGLTPVVSSSNSAASALVAGTQMHVQEMHLATKGTGFGIGGLFIAAYVHIVDEGGNAVEGAKVTGDFSGSFVRNGVSATTDPTGVAIIAGKPFRCGATSTFTVTNVTKAGMTYVPSANLETTDSATFLC